MNKKTIAYIEQHILMDIVDILPENSTLREFLPILAEYQMDFGLLSKAAEENANMRLRLSELTDDLKIEARGNKIPKEKYSNEWFRFNFQYSYYLNFYLAQLHLILGDIDNAFQAAEIASKDARNYHELCQKKADEHAAVLNHQEMTEKDRKEFLTELFKLNDIQRAAKKRQAESNALYALICLRYNRGKNRHLIKAAIGFYIAAKDFITLQLWYRAAGCSRMAGICYRDAIPLKKYQDDEGSKKMFAIRSEENFKNMEMCLKQARPGEMLNVGSIEGWSGE